MRSQTTLVWLRDDLRIRDNPALRHAVDNGGAVVVVYVLDEVSDGVRPMGDASRWWLHHSLLSLGQDLVRIGGRLVLRRGAAVAEINAIASETGAAAVFWNHRYSASRDLDAEVARSLRTRGIEVESFQANLLFEPATVTTAEGRPFRIFTPFWRACLGKEPPRLPLPAPDAMVSREVQSDLLDDWNLLPTKPDWAAGLRARWHPGEPSAQRALHDFVGDGLARYDRRDEPALDSTSRLSAHLRFGEISPFDIWNMLHGDLGAAARRNADAYLRQLIWREFSWNTLFHSPELATENFKPEFDAFPWAEPTREKLGAWQRGETGIPLVDAGMRELWTTGYMHNRVRLVAASFLVKNLLIDWRIGEQWFWNTLVDADEANNPANWQWVAGSGADAAPYFRIFNPVLQAAKFDPEGEYIARWLPETGRVSQPIVDLAETRRAAMDAYDIVKRSGGRQ